VRPALLLVAVLSLPAAAASKASFSEVFTAGSGPYLGNSISAGVSPSRVVDIDLGYDVGTDQDLVVFHSLWGSLGFWPAESVRISLDGDFGPNVSSDSPTRGHYALGSAGGGGSIAFHPGGKGDVRPYLQIGGGIEHLDVEGSQTAGAPNPIGASFTQTSISGNVGFDVDYTSVRFGASKFFYDQDAGALQLPPGIGSGPLSLGAGQSALPTRAEDWNVRASLRQRFGDDHVWDTTIRFTFAPYVDGNGSIVATNVRLGREITRNVRGFLGLTGQVETLSSATFGLFGTAGLSVLF